MKNTEVKLGTYCDLMNDVAFRWIFTKESNSALLRDFLNELITDREITDVLLYKDSQMPFSKEFKKSVFDVSCKTGDGTMIDVEVQLSKQDWFADRCLYYSTFNIQKQVSESIREYRLKPVYVVSIDNFTRNHGPGWDGRIRSTYSLREDECHELMTDNLHFIFIELDRFDKRWEETASDRERIYYCIKHLHEYETLPAGMATGLVARLAEQSRICEMPPELKEIYIKSMVTEIDKRAQLLCATRTGREEGFRAGIAKGIATGRAEGIATGRTAMLQAIRNLKAAGVPDETISQCTGLSLEDLPD